MFEPGDLIRVTRRHMSLPVDGATLRVTMVGDRHRAKYLIPHPTFAENAISFNPSYVEKV